QRWECTKMGAGPPPLKTDKGWLLIYHGRDENMTYRAGAALLDLEEPWKVLARTPEPILEPEEEYERIGDMPNVVFPEGAVVIGDELFVFYGGADLVCCAASVHLDEFVDYLLRLAQGESSQ
ncbi:MAG: glycosidase, partial [Chloroflexota bacterium]|nr:glycosidase [Chloroflexota bacterium]